MRLLFVLFCLTIVSCRTTIKDELPSAPSNLKYMSVFNAREGQEVVTMAPTVETGGLMPKFELISITREDGSLVDASLLEDVRIGQSTSIEQPVDIDLGYVDGDGNPITFVSRVNSANNGVITIVTGHRFSAGNYYFKIKVTTESDGFEYSTVFDKGFHLHVGPLLPTILVYTPKTQNLVYGDSKSKTSAAIMPSANPDVTFELATESDKLTINKVSGEVSIAPAYVYTGYETLYPTIRIVNNFSGESVLFKDKLTVVITDKPEEMPTETIYLFYPTLFATGSYPTGGDGFSVQVIRPGNGEDIWGEIDNSNGRAFVAPPERPTENRNQTVLETQTYRGTVSEPTTSWMVTTTQDLTPYRYGYKLSFNYYYMPAFHVYMADGRTPDDLEVYLSTDYKGGTIQDAAGNWLNGTWTKVNAQMKCQKSLGVNSSNVSSGAPWGEQFIGTPYPGDQKGADPDGLKRPELGTFYGKWVKCTYDIAPEQITNNVTVAFKVESRFTGKLENVATAPVRGRGGHYFLSDFYYKAEEPKK